MTEKQSQNADKLSQKYGKKKRKLWQQNELRQKSKSAFWDEKLNIMRY